LEEADIEKVLDTHAAEIFRRNLIRADRTQ
jgi:hypothetical protein